MAATAIVRVRCRTAEADAAAVPPVDVPVPVSQGDLPAAAVADAAVRAAGGQPAALAASGGRTTAFHRPGPAFPWLPAGSAAAGAKEHGVEEPALIVCVTAADATVPDGMFATAAVSSVPESLDAGDNGSFYKNTETGAIHYVANDFSVDSHRRDLGKVLELEVPSDPEATGFGSFFNIRCETRGWYINPVREIRDFCVAHGIPLGSR